MKVELLTNNLILTTKSLEIWSEFLKSQVTYLEDDAIEIEGLRHLEFFGADERFGETIFGHFHI